MESSKRNNPELNSKKVKEGFIGQKMIVLPPNIKKAVVNTDLIKGFYLTAIGYYPHAVSHDRERKFGASQYILLYCTEGKGVITIQDLTIDLKPNSFFIIPKQIPHHYKSFAGRSMEYLLGTFCWPLCRSDVRKVYERTGDLLSIPYDERRITIFDEIFSLLENSFAIRDLEIINIKLKEFIASFIYYKEINPAFQDDDVVASSIAFMKENLGSLISVDELAARELLSVSHYSRLFRKKREVPPINILTSLKFRSRANTSISPTVT